MTGVAERWTPEKAKRAARWWRLAGICFGLVGGLVSFTGFGMFAVPLLIPAFVCVSAAAEQDGWRSGYLARAREAGR